MHCIIEWRVEWQWHTAWEGCSGCRTEQEWRAQWRIGPIGIAAPLIFWGEKKKRWESSYCVTFKCWQITLQTIFVVHIQTFLQLYSSLYWPPTSCSLTIYGRHNLFRYIMRYASASCPSWWSLFDEDYNYRHRSFPLVWGVLAVQIIHICYGNDVLGWQGWCLSIVVVRQSPRCPYVTVFTTERIPTYCISGHFTL
jgi:hypothetical protein